MFNKHIYYVYLYKLPGHVAQSVTCLPADTCLTADLGVANSILAWSDTYVEMDHRIFIFCGDGHSPPSADSRRLAVSYKRKFEHEVLG